MAMEKNSKIIGAIHLVKIRADAARESEKQRTQARLKTIFNAAKMEPERVIATKDLEAMHEAQDSVVRNVKPIDSMVVKAGRGTLIYTFMDIDRLGRLSVLAFNNGRYEGEHLLRPGESEIIGRGMLMSFKPFRLALTRLRVQSAQDGIIACVELRASLDSAPGGF
jgi:hypothetical protein